ncbi:MAG: type II toxin-antitoxin system VapC family toxin [Kiritimatiellia bacterium]
MNYWDSSALVTLFVEQAQSGKYLIKVEQDPQVLTAWHAVPECASAFCRLRREMLITESELNDVLIRLEEQSGNWFIITPGKRLEKLTLRALRVHPLRAMDAIHLAAACLARAEEGPPMDFYSEDTRLMEAAAKEGFHI